MTDRHWKDEEFCCRFTSLLYLTRLDVLCHEIISAIDNNLWNGICVTDESGVCMWHVYVCVYMSFTTKISGHFMLNEPTTHFVEASFLSLQRKQGFVLGICFVLEVTGAFIIKLNQEWQGEKNRFVYFFTRMFFS